MQSIIDHLTTTELNGERLFKKVEEAIDIATVIKSPLTVSPVAYVLEQSRRPGKNSRISGNALQNIETTVAVVIGITKRNDKTGSKTLMLADDILTQTRKAMFGFKPSEEHTRFVLANADTIGVNDHALWKIERFTTEHLEEAIQHDN